MKLLVVGASGFIGTNFVLSCPRNWEIIATYNREKRLEKLVKKKKLKNVKLVKCDLTKQVEVKKLAKIIEKKPVNVLFLAGNSDPQFSYMHPIRDLEQNVLSLLNFLGNVNVNKLVYFSSGAVYHGLRGAIDPSKKIDPKLPYAISKMACEQYIKYYHERGKVKNYVIIRFFGAYGPFEPPRKIYTKLVRAFHIEKKNTFEIYGDGKNLIDAFYIDELIRVLKKILGSKKGNVILDVCLAKPMNINELVKKAAKLFGIKNLKIKHFGKSAEPIYFRPSQKLLQKHFGIKIKDNIARGLKKLAKHIEAS